MNDEKLHKKIVKYAKMLGKEDTIDHGLRRLESIPMTFELLKQTMVGKEVNVLSRRPEYAERAKNLVTKWRNMAAKAVAPPTSPKVEPEDSGADSNTEDFPQRDNVTKSQTLMVSTNSSRRSPSSDTSGPSKRHESKKQRKLKRPAVKVEDADEADDAFAATDQHKLKKPAIKMEDDDEADDAFAAADQPKLKRPTIKVEDDDEEHDAFAAAMAAADRVSTAPKRPRPQPSKKARQTDANLAEDIERSLAELEASSQPSTRFSSPALSLKADGASDPSALLKQSRDKMRKVYAGKRKTQAMTEIPKLYDLCLRTCMNNIELTTEYLPYVGFIPYKILKPILEKCSHSQLLRIENKNQYLKDDTDELWQRHCQREFNRGEVGSDDEDADLMWRERFMLLTREREARLAQLSRQINTNTMASMAPQKNAILTDPIAPRDARRRQIKNGIVVSANRVPSAAELSRSRRQIFENGNKSDLIQLPKAVRNTTSTVGGKFKSAPPSSSASTSNGRQQPPKRGALMLKTMRMMKGRPR